MRIVEILKKIYLSKSLKNIIVFESVPDLSDNTKAVFDEFIRRGYNDKYKLIWFVDCIDKRYPKIKNVKYIKNKLEKTLLAKLARMNVSYRARCFISCNRCLTPCREGQTAFYLSHGTPIKSVRHFYAVPESIDYACVASPHLEEMYAYEKHIDKSKMKGLGYPRNDELYNKADVKKILGTDCSKVIVWYPTYRQNKNQNGMKLETASLPFLDNEIVARDLNAYAKEQGVLIVAKPHFAQDISVIRDLKLSNILLIDDEFFLKNNISSYTFVGNCDALLTDYSSIYYDFTLCDKPIGVIWIDIDSYRKNPGFAVDLDFYLKGAEKIYQLDEFKQFIFNVANGIDVLKKERNEIKEFVNYATDGRNSERIVDFIIDKAKL